MPRVVAWLLPCCLLAGPATAAAQAPLSLADAVAATLSHNASLGAVRAAADAKAAAVDEARADWFPRVSFGESWQRGDQPVFVFSSLLAARRFGPANLAIDALNQPAAVSSFTASARVQETLFDGFQRAAARTAASRERDIAERTVDQTRADLALETTEAFGRLLTAQARERAAEGAAAAAREDLRRAGERRDAGLLSDADVLALQVYLARVEQQRVQADGDAAATAAELDRLMDVPVDRQWQAVEPAPAADASPTPATADLPALFAEADAARPEVARADAAVELAHATQRLARSGLLPQVSVQGGVDASGTRFADRASTWIVGASVQWSVSTGGAERARLAEAADGLERARAEAADARMAAHVDVVRALHAIDAARARQALGRAAVDQAHESERIIRNRFAAGLASVTDVLRASGAVLDAESDRIAAAVDVMTGEARLRHALGRQP